MSAFEDLVDQVNELSDNQDQMSNDFQDLGDSLGGMTERPGQLDFPLDDKTVQLIKGCFSTGTGTLFAGAMTVYSAAITTSSMIYITRTSLGASGTAGYLYVYQQQSESFTVKSSSSTDTSSFNYLII